MADARDRVDESHHTESRDRRRPGRIENASPHLVPLLRQQSAGSGTEAPTDLGSGDGSAESCEDDGIAASRGIVVGGIIGLQCGAPLRPLYAWSLEGCTAKAAVPARRARRGHRPQPGTSTTR